MNGKETSLSFAYQGLTELPEKIIRRYGQSVEHLDLTENDVIDFRFLENFTKLSTLIIDHNNINSHVKFPVLTTLHTLWVNHNSITNQSVFVASLARSFPNLQELSMMNNEAAPSYFNGGTYMQYIDYRYQVISQLPNLKFLDDKAVSKEEREEAERIYKNIRFTPRPAEQRPRSRSVKKKTTPVENT